MNKTTRFLNFIIDAFVFYVLAIIISFLVRDRISQQHLRYFLIAGYYIYYLLFELMFSRTPGKWITKTVVVDCDTQQKASPTKILVRTLSRIIPLDIFSYLFSANGWHDSLSKTKLIKSNV